MRRPIVLPALLSLAVLLAPPAAPPPTDPPVPPGGFQVRAWLGLPLTYADGYRTRCDVRAPDPAFAAPPASGWPAVLIVHALRSDRAALAVQARALSARGYLTICPDVRGQGETRSLNPSGGGSTFVGPVEKADMAEVFAQTEQNFGALCDADRLAVVGFSQGALHALAAAAWSGRPLPAPRGAITHFPRILAVHCDAALGTSGELSGRDGAVFDPLGLGPFLFPDGLVPDPATAATLRDVFVRQDFNAWAAWQQQPGRDDAAAFAATTTAVLCQTSWDDEWVPPNSILDRLATLPATTPRAVLIETGDHGAPPNLVARATRDERELRWLDHFLKGVADELPRQPVYTLGLSPAQPNAYADPLGIWEQRQVRSFPDDPGTRIETLWPRSGGRLAGSPPTVPEPADTVRHRVAPGFDPQAWLATANDTRAVLAQVPLSQVTFRSEPLAAERELRGRPRLRLELSSAAVDLQVGVVLFDEAPDGTRRQVSSGFTALRGRRPGGSNPTVELGDCCTLVPAGHRLLLAIENLVWHRPPGQSRLRTAPYFASYSFDVEHGPVRTTRLELPFATARGFGCRAAIVRVGQARGGTILVALAGGPARAGQAYATLVSLSGTLPGTAVLGTPVPLNFDPLTELGLLAAGSPTLPGFVGTLGSNGEAYALLNLAPGLLPATWVGRSLSFSALVLGPAGLSAGPSSTTRIAD